MCISQIWVKTKCEPKLSFFYLSQIDKRNCVIAIFLVLMTCLIIVSTDRYTERYNYHIFIYFRNGSGQASPECLIMIQTTKEMLKIKMT